MTEAMIAAILEQIDQLKRQEPELDPSDYVDAMDALLRDLLPSRGLSVYSPGFEDDPPLPSGFDALLLPHSDAGPIPVVFDPSDRVVTDTSVRHLTKKAAEAGFKESLLIIQGTWGASALRAANDYDTNSVHLADLATLSEWARNPAALALGLEHRARALRRTSAFSRGLALDIADDPEMLNEIEWRDVERILNEVLNGLGYGVLLTPSSKDGGKDLVVRCLNFNKIERYYIEIKHWRSGIAPGEKVLKKFAKLIIKDKVQKGLVLSSSGFTTNAFDGLSEQELNLVACGDSQKIFSLCQYYKLVRAGVRIPPANPAELLFNNTTSPLLISKAG